MPLLKIILRKICVCLVMIGVTQASLAEVLPGMKGLQNNTVANADDLNQNFEVLSEQALTNEERIERLEDTSTRLFRETENPALVFSAQSRLLDDGLVELTGGRLELNVDCGADPWALVDAYQSYGRYKELVFTLSGSVCYGAFFYNRAYTEAFREPLQAITLKSADPQSPTSITPRPNDPNNTNILHDQQITIGTKDGSSLTIDSINLRLGNCDIYGVYVERNSNLTLSGVHINDFTGTAPACALFPGQPIRESAISVDHSSSLQIRRLNTNSRTETVIDVIGALVGIWAQHASSVYVGQNLSVETAISDASWALRAMWLQESFFHMESGDLTLASPAGTTSPSYALQASNSHIDIESNSPIKATGEFVVEGGSFSAWQGIILTNPDNDGVDFTSTLAHIAGYDPQELPASRIQCAGPHTLDFTGARTDGSIGYIPHSDGVLSGLHSHCVSKQGWISLLLQATE